MTITAAEQYFIERVNAARLDPLSAARDRGVALNAGLAGGTITAESKAVLAPQALLQQAAADHTANMLARDFFNHTDPAGDDDEDRVRDLGYRLDGDGAVGENIALVSSTGQGGLSALADALYATLFDSPSHRRNMLSPDYQEIGAAIRVGDYQGFAAALATQVFATPAGPDAPILTGVAFQDRNGDRAYDIGEALAGVTIAAQGDAVKTAAAGGYALQLDAGDDVVVTLSQGRRVIGTVAVDLGAQNAKLDLIQTAQGPLLALSASATLVTGITQARLLGLDDLDLEGGRGNDRLVGNAGDNSLVGGAGRDRLEGRAGADRLEGGKSNDVLTGGDGGDVFVFSAGGDRIADWGRGDRLMIDAQALGQPDLTLADLRRAATGTDAGLVMTLGDHSLTLTGLAAFGDLGGRVDIV